MPLVDAIDAPVIEATTRSVTVAVTDDRDLDRLLAQAREAGSVARFDYDLPSLQDAFTAIAGQSASVGAEREAA